MTLSSVTVSISGAPSNFSAARLIVGLSYKPGAETGENIDYGWEHDLFDLGGNEVLPTGVEDDYPLARVMRFRAAWGWQTEAEARVQQHALSAYAGRSRPVLFCADADAADRHNVIGYGVFTDSIRAKHIAVDGYTSAFELRSRLITSL